MGVSFINTFEKENMRRLRKKFKNFYEQKKNWKKKYYLLESRKLQRPISGLREEKIYLPP
jgi:coproporphyrinogen III oxidase